MAHVQVLVYAVISRRKTCTTIPSRLEVVTLWGNQKWPVGFLRHPRSERLPPPPPAHGQVH